MGRVLPTSADSSTVAFRPGLRERTPETHNPFLAPSRFPAPLRACITPREVTLRRRVAPTQSAKVAPASPWFDQHEPEHKRGQDRQHDEQEHPAEHIEFDRVDIRRDEPEDGKTYQVSAHLESVDIIVARIDLGLPDFGKSKVLHRVSHGTSEGWLSHDLEG